MSPEDLTGFVYVGSPRISPDGSRIVFTHKTVGEKNNYRTNLLDGPTDGSDEPRPYTSSDKDAALRGRRMAGPSRSSAIASNATRRFTSFRRAAANRAA
jgi:hypothetical protein